MDGRQKKSRATRATSDELAAHGVDAIRLTMRFCGPPEDDIDWADVSPPERRSSARLAAGRGRDFDVGTDPATGDEGRKVTHHMVHDAQQAVEAQIVSTLRWQRRWSWSTR